MRNILSASSATLVVAACSQTAPDLPAGSGGSMGGATDGSGGGGVSGSGGGGISGTGGDSPAGGAITSGGDATAGSFSTDSGSNTGTTTTGSMGGGSGTGGGTNDAMGGGSGTAGGTNDAKDTADASTEGDRPDGDSTNMGNIAAVLDGLRLDDPCAGTPTTGITCKHASGATFNMAKTVTVGGVTGTTYNVKIRVRGIVEDQQYNGGSQPDAKVPFNIGGTEALPNYERWRITVSSPSQSYHLNQFNKTIDAINAVDYTVTIPIAGKSTVTLDGYDSNDHEIYDYTALTVAGVPGSMNKGQFVELSVVSAKAQ